MKKITRQTTSENKVKPTPIPKPKTGPPKEEQKKIQPSIKSSNFPTSSRSLKNKKSEKLSQSQSVIFKLPQPIQIEIFLFSISSGKDIMRMSLVCKRVKEWIQKDPRPWLSLIIHNFPKLLAADFQILKSRLNEGYIDNKKDWKPMYIQEYIKNIEKANETNIKKLISLCKPITAHKFFQAFKNAPFKFTLKKGRIETKIKSKNVTFLDQSLIIKVDLERPNENLGNLVVCLYGKITEFSVRSKKDIKDGKIKLISNDHGLEINLAEDTYTQYWILSYAEIYKKVTNFALTRVFNGNASRLGMINYSAHIDLSNGNSSIASHSERVLDLNQEGSCGRGIIEKLKYKIPKDKMILDWKTFAFSDKIDGVCFLSFTIFDEQGRLFAWGSNAAVTEFVEYNGNEGDGFSLTGRSENCSITCYLRDKGKSYVLVSIVVDLALEHIHKFIY